MFTLNALTEEHNNCIAYVLEALTVLPYSSGMPRSHNYMSCPVPSCYHQWLIEIELLYTTLLWDQCLLLWKQVTQPDGNIYFL